MAQYAMAGLNVVQGVMSAAGTVAQGNAAYASAAENARIQSENAARLAESARITQEQGVTAAYRRRRQGRILKGNTLAALSVSGVDVAEGSPLEVLSEQAKETEFQAQQDQFEFDQRAWQIRAGAYDTSQRAFMTLRQGQQYRDASYSAAIGQVVGGAAKGGAAAYDLLKKPEATTSPYGGPTAARPD